MRFEVIAGAVAEYRRPYRGCVTRTYVKGETFYLPILRRRACEAGCQRRRKEREDSMHFFQEDEQEERRTPEPLALRLLKARTVMISGQVDQELAERVISQLLIMDAESSDPIRVVITSQGGHVDSGYAIHDVMRYALRSEVLAIGAGWVASIAVPILFGATKPNRMALPNTRFLLHQPSGGAGGHLSDIRIEAQEIMKIREKLNKLLAQETGKDVEQIARDSDRNFWMSAEEALEYGIINQIISSVDDLKR